MTTRNYPLNSPNRLLHFAPHESFSFSSFLKMCVFYKPYFLLLVTLSCHGIIWPFNPRDLKKPTVSNFGFPNFGFEDLETRLLSVEQRLRSIEEPMWEIGGNDITAWDRCTEGSCRCEPSTGRLSCWRNKLKSLPSRQYIPNDIVAMWVGIIVAVLLVHYSDF